MIVLSQERTKRLVAVHGWSGTVLGLLLYAVVLTGAVAVFAHEIGSWSRGGDATRHGLPSTVHRHLEAHMGLVDPAYHAEVSIGTTDAGALRLSFQQPMTNPESGQIEDHAHVFHVDPVTGETLRHQEGFLRALRAGEAGAALERFLIDLHVRLYVPEPWGLFLTGVLGLAMMVAAISGVLMHRHLLRDLYTAPRGRGLLSDKRDRHVLAAAWGVPFSILLAFTGAFFSFALSLGLPVVAMVAFGGDQQALIETVIGNPEAVDPRPAPLASLDYVLHDSAERAGSPSRTVLIENTGTVSSRLTVFHGATGGALTGTTHMFDGVSRAFLGEKPTLGTKPSAGSAAVSLMAPLHFGNFAGFASKTTWFALGLAMAFVIATGMQLWVRRRQESRLWQRFDRAVVITLWGLPIALLGAAVAFFLARPVGDPLWWTPVGFLVAGCGAITLGLSPRDPAARYRRVVALLCIGLPVLRHLTGGASWSEVLLLGQFEVLTIDLLLLISGSLLSLADAPRLFLRARVLEPAE